MRRREFIKLIAGSAVACPHPARAQQPTMPVVGLVSGRLLDSSARPGAAFTKGLSEAGYVEDKNVMVEYHWVGGQYDRAIGDPPTLAAKAATATIPIAFGISEDPVRHGVVASLGVPSIIEVEAEGSFSVV
jgi:putative tryptophan/tyrosine transport system substrate-binding protein